MSQDQRTKARFTIEDSELSRKEHVKHGLNDASRERSKAHPDIAVGDIVYIHQDGSKIRSIDLHLVVAFEKDWCYPQVYGRSVSLSFLSCSTA